MRLEEFADIIRRDIIVRRYANQDNRWMAHFEHAETKDNEFDSCLTGTYADGKSPDEAIRNYAEAISGKLLVLDAFGEKRKEYMCPKQFDLL